MKLKIICVPHAGGSVANYTHFKNYVDENKEIKPIELPGRGRRISVPFITRWEDAVIDLYGQIAEEITEGPYVLFGHSLGSWLVYELYYKILKEGKPLPVHIFLSGNVPPKEMIDKNYYTNMSDAVFMERILIKGGTPKVIFENEALRELFLPILRADYDLVARYMVTQGRELMQCNVTLLNGKEDVFERGEIEQWQSYTSGKTEAYYFEGGHFYLFDIPEQIMGLIKDQVTNY